MGQQRAASNGTEATPERGIKGRKTGTASVGDNRKDPTVRPLRLDLKCNNNLSSLASSSSNIPAAVVVIPVELYD
jgi:hypothetical protein